MNARITKKRLGDLLAYDWIKILACIVAAVVAWSLIFTVAAVRLKTGQSFDVFLYGNTFTDAGIADYVENIGKHALSYDVLEVNSQTIPTGNYAAQVLQARASTHEGDLFFLDDADTGGDKPNNDSIFRSVADNYSLMTMDDLYAEAQKYLSSFFDGEGTMNEGAVAANFDKRMKGDNRFRKASDRARGLEREKERLTKLKGDAEWFGRLLAADDAAPEGEKLFAVYKKYDQAKALDPDNADRYPETAAARYGLRLEMLEKGSDLVRNADGNCKNVYVTVFDYAKWQPDLQYETISAIRYLVEAYGDLEI